jgi:hypothetical protein
MKPIDYNCQVTLKSQDVIKLIDSSNKLANRNKHGWLKEQLRALMLKSEKVKK